MASFMWLVTPGFTGDWHVSTVVTPSSSRSTAEGPGSRKSLARNRSGRNGAGGGKTEGLELLMLFTATGTNGADGSPANFRTVAQFTPLTKNAKTSLYSVATYSEYSSE